MPSTGAAEAAAERESGCSSGVEHNLAKVGVEGSNPFARSSSSPVMRQIDQRVWVAARRRTA